MTALNLSAEGGGVCVWEAEPEGEFGERVRERERHAAVLLYSTFSGTVSLPPPRNGGDLEHADSTEFPLKQRKYCHLHRSLIRPAMRAGVKRECGRAQTLLCAHAQTEARQKQLTSEVASFFSFPLG